MSSSANGFTLSEAKVPKTLPTMSDSLHENGGMDLRIAMEIWRKLAESEARLHLMVELGHLEVGFPDVENF